MDLLSRALGCSPGKRALDISDGRPCGLPSPRSTACGDRGVADRRRRLDHPSQAHYARGSGCRGAAACSHTGHAVCSLGAGKPAPIAGRAARRDGGNRFQRLLQDCHVTRAAHLPEDSARTGAGADLSALLFSVAAAPAAAILQRRVHTHPRHLRLPPNCRTRGPRRC